MKDFNFDIWRLQTQSNVRGLLDAIKSSDPTLRQKAAMALRVMGSASALPALQDALLTETDKETRDILIVTLEALFSQQHEDDTMPERTGSQVVEFIARLNSSNTEHAVRAAQGLGEIQEKLAVEALMVTFNNRQLSARVRLAAAEALIRLQSPTSDISLLVALRSERWSVRRSAAAVLGQMDADWAVEPLIKALQDPYEVVSRTARAALERIDTPEARRALVAADEPRLPEPVASSAAVVTPEAAPALPPVTLTEASPAAVVVPVPESSPATPRVSITIPPELQQVISPEPPAPAQLPTTATDHMAAGIVAAANLSAADAGTANPQSSSPPPTEEDTRPMTPVPDDVS